MKKNYHFEVIILLSTILFGSSFCPSLWAYWVWSPEAGKFINSEETVQNTAEEQYDYAMEFYKKKDLKETAKHLRLLLKAYPGSQVASEAQFRLGVVNEEMGDYYRAFRAYRDLIQKYPQSERISEAVRREFQIGNLFLSGRKAKVLGLEILPSGPRAIEVFKHLVDTAPFSEYGDKAQFHLGLAYKKTNQFEEAIQAFQGVIDQYAKSPLVPQARFQIADTSYLQSVAASRDQRVIDRASEEIEEFLKHYPDSGVSDKAAKLRQEIDEKNAEKNYRIALFYEKENFLDSAFIYYRDVSDRYPQTLWGQKARERLQALEKPAEFLKAQEAEIASAKAKLVQELGKVGSTDPSQKKELEWQIKRLEKEVKDVGHSKKDTLKRRRAAWKQKKVELQASRKALQAKKKRFKHNPSEDLAAAFKRWETALEQEMADLEKEKHLIENWETSLGVSTEPFYAELMPFGRPEATPVEQVRRLEAKRLNELARASKKILSEKENLYRQYEELLTLEEGGSGVRQDLRAEREKLDGIGQEIGQLEKKLRERQAVYQKHYGGPALGAIWQTPKTLIERSVGILNPFEEDIQKDWNSKSLSELETLESHWREKVASQKVLIDTISQAFDEELAQAEEKRLLSKVGEKETDPSALRRAVKQLEREIRSRYSEIQDRNERKNELLEELEKTLRGEADRRGGGGFLTAPVRGTYGFWKSFLFGLPERDVELTQEAKQAAAGDTAQAGKIRGLREQIELESVLIEARNREIQRYERELEAVRAQASLSNTPQFRSLLVKFPYVFVREAIVSARRLVPKEDRREKLIEQLNRETEELGRSQKGLEKIQELIAKKKGKEEALPAPAAPEKAPDQKALRGEIQTLEKQLGLQKDRYEHERERFEASRWEKISEGRRKARSEKLKEIEEKLAQRIEKEQKLREEESILLGKKREAVEQFLKQVSTDVFSQELNLEKKEIESRMDQLQKRQSTLGEEIKRFRPQAFPPSQ